MDRKNGDCGSGGGLELTIQGRNETDIDCSDFVKILWSKKNRARRVTCAFAGAMMGSNSCHGGVRPMQYASISSKGGCKIEKG